MKSSPQKNNQLFWFIIIVVVICAFVIYVATLGKVNIADGDSLEELAEKRRLAQERHDELEKIVQTKEELKIKLDRKFNWIYGGISSLFLILFFGVNTLIYWYYNVALDKIVMWNGIVAGSYGVINVVLLRSKFPVKAIVQYIRISIENKIYSQHINITSEIEEHKAELNDLKTSLSTLPAHVPIASNGNNLTTGPETA